ncbi:MAG: hypothetical protein AAGK14_05485 [Verrucomicrobiota bacterium]
MTALDLEARKPTPVVTRRTPEPSQRFDPSRSAYNARLTEEMRQGLVNLQDLFSQEQLAFSAVGQKERVVEALRDYQADWVLGTAKLEIALEELDATSAAELFDVLTRHLPADDDSALAAYRMYFRAWGGVDGAAAVARSLEELPATRLRLEAGREALLSWAGDDPGSAAEHLTTMPETYGKDYLIYALPAAYIGQAPTAAMEWAQSLSPQYRRNALLHSTLAWVDTDLEAAKEYATQLSEESDAIDEASGVIFSRVGKALVREDPAAAAAWAESLPATSVARQQAMLGVIDQWGVADPEGASAWLQRFEASPVVDPAIERFALDAAEIDPPTAAAWANTISDPGRRVSSLETVLNAWMAQDAEEAQNWAQEHGYRLEANRPAQGN